MTNSHVFIRMMVAALLLAVTTIVTAATSLPRKQLLNDQWQFVEKDSDFTKAQSVVLPHDWSVYHRFDVNAPAGNDGAYLPTGKGWYRRTLTLGKAYAGKKIRINIGRNEIVVSVDNSQQKNCRWYSGSGIYRNVWLVTTPKTYIDDWSVQVTTPDIHHVNLSATVIREDGTTFPLERTIEVEEPRLWSPDDPYLYEAELAVPDGDTVVAVSLKKK